MEPHVAIVEDDASISQVLGLHFERAGYAVRRYTDAAAALADADGFLPDLVVLDLGLPGMDGFAFLQALRQERDLPVLVLTARADTRDKVKGFGLGADDYVVKPFDSEEVLARARALLRRSGRLTAEAIALGPLRVDRQQYAVHLGDVRVSLSPREVDLLFALAQSPNRALTRAQLLDRVWGMNADVEDRVVDAYITRVRKKLLEAWPDKRPTWRIETVWGVGYKLSVEDRAT